MSVSQHPIALRLERQVGGATKLLATVMALPLVDGIFPALVLAGVLDSAFGILETGLLIFGGSATVAVILAEMDGTRRQQATSVLLIGALIVPVAGIQAALAPTIEGLLNMAVFERFAGLVILTIAAKTASSKVGESLPSPAVIISLGLVASFQPAGAELALLNDPETVLRGAAAAGVGVAFALGVATLSPQLRGRVDIDRFRFGSAVALGVLALPILLGPFGVMQTDAPVALAVLAVTGLFAYDPESEGIGSERDDDSPDDRGAEPEDQDAPAAEDDSLPGADPTPEPVRGDAPTATDAAADGSGSSPPADSPAVVTDGDGEPAETVEEPDASDRDGDDSGESRAPWL
ncbi:DUF5794 domain-containing protein [Haloparvum sedimenti]|uniref:DUF5794 domain-containing protein n=1 Tax=Haloparvum sedimenti TaxID=1678448 RepID=UPI00071E7F39|nr:DUF5794 domain-containing protein [Haloparvum sedimenti]